MTNQEILTKAIQKAINGGWAPHNDERPWTVNDVLSWYMLLNVSRVWNEDNWKKFIFSHDFAKALWPENKCTCGAISTEPHRVFRGKFTIHSPGNDWRHYLREMVIAGDPIKYLGEHLDA